MKISTEQLRSRSTHASVLAAATLAAASLFGTQSASAQTFSNNFTDSSGDHLMSNAANWSLGRKSYLEDDVTFGNGTAPVTAVLETGSVTAARIGRLHFNNPFTITFSGNSGGNGQ